MSINGSPIASEKTLEGLAVAINQPADGQLRDGRGGFRFIIG
jgi:hypothetical protein